MNTLLLTGTIKPSPHILFLNIKDPETRYAQYVQNIVRYICFSDFDAIIFCENSGYEIKDSDTLQHLAKIFGKRLEILQFAGDHDKSIKKGRGFGENEILEYAIQHSTLIKESGKFIKITGRYWCENINRIIHGSAHKDVCFSKLMPTSLLKLDSKAVNTAFFKTSVKFFNEALAGAGEDVDDTRIFFLEHVYYERLKKFAKKINPLPEYPKMRGTTGEGGILKKGIFIEIIIYILHKLGINRI